MEGQKKLDYENEKYLEELLIEKGFFKIKNLNLAEKEKKYKKNYEILEYQKEDIKKFLDFLILSKKKSKKLIVSKLDKIKKELKSENHLFYNCLLNQHLGIDLGNFLTLLLEEIKLELQEQFPIFNFFHQNMVADYGKIYCQAKIRTLIRENRIVEKPFQNLLPEIKYEKKLFELEKETNNLLNYLNKEFFEKSQLQEILLERTFQQILSDKLTQLIVLDILHENIPKEKRDFLYEQLFKFLKEKNKEIEEERKNISLSSPREEIFLDFFKFLILTKDILKDKQTLEIEKELIDNKIDILVPPLDKKTQFLNYIYSLNEKKERDIIYCSNFLELEEVKQRIDKETGTLKVSECLELLDIFKSTKTEFSKKLYGSNKPKNNFDIINQKINKAIKKYPFLAQESLEMRKVIINILEKDKTLISPFRKTLKNLVNNEIANEIVEVNIRLRITQNMYSEKGIPEEFERSYNLRELLNRIFYSINLIKKKEVRENYFKSINEYFFNLLKETYKNENVVSVLIPFEFYINSLSLTNTSFYNEYYENMKKNDIMFQKYSNEEKEMYEMYMFFKNKYIL